MPEARGATAGAPQILWLHSHFLNWTGGHQYVYEVIKRLRGSYDIRLIASAASAQAEQKFAEIAVNLRKVNVRSTNSAAFWLTLPVQIQRERNRILRTTSPKAVRATISSMFPMNVVAEQLEAPHVQLCWEPYALFWDEPYLKDFKPSERVFCRVMRLAYGSLDLDATRKASALLTLSDFNRRWIGSVYGRDDGRLTYEGVDGQFFRPTRSPQVDDRYPDRKIILHSTDFTATKGTEHLIRALPFVRQGVPDVKVLITHTLTNPDRKRQMQDLASNLGVLDLLDFIGRVDYQLLPAYYTRADVVVQPSINQSMSLSVKEAMACGTPIVTSPEGHEQTVDGDAGFLVDPRDSSALGGAIVRILSDGGLAARMGERGREITATRFSWDSVAATFERAIEDVA
jgi:glycosyltransferase involved in cell wall biosynthesis